MVLAAVVISPVGMTAAAVTFTHPLLLGAGCGVGVCSSVIPYVTDQLAMARLSRAALPRRVGAADVPAGGQRGDHRGDRLASASAAARDPRDRAGRRRGRAAGRDSRLTMGSLTAGLAGYRAGLPRAGP